MGSATDESNQLACYDNEAVGSATDESNLLACDDNEAVGSATDESNLLACDDNEAVGSATDESIKCTEQQRLANFGKLHDRKPEVTASFR